MHMEAPSTSGSQLVAGPAGALEVMFDLPSAAPVGIVVVTHPQPLLGGHAQHKVPQLLARALCEAGWLVARPNFRGVGRSAGVHDLGQGETEDVYALCTALRASYPHKRLALVGFSFGAYVQARVARALSEAGVPAWRVGLAGIPFGTVESGRKYDTPDGLADALVVQGERDRGAAVSCLRLGAAQQATRRCRSGRRPLLHRQATRAAPTHASTSVRLSRRLRQS